MYILAELKCSTACTTLLQDTDNQYVTAVVFFTLNMRVGCLSHRSVHGAVLSQWCKSTTWYVSLWCILIPNLLTSVSPMCPT